jgi:putative endonuclease
VTNHAKTLYVGMTNDLERRVLEHNQKLIEGFTSKYNISQLVWYEVFNDVHQALEAEKKLKGWRRSKKTALIETVNRRGRTLLPTGTQ